MSSRIPPPLQLYIDLPPSDSLTLVTSVLGASANWLILQYLCAVLRKHGEPRRNQVSASGQTEAQGQEEMDDRAIVFVSWLQDWNFWKTEARRTASLDLEGLHRNGRFAFVDGLTQLFSVPGQDLQDPMPATAASSTAQRGQKSTQGSFPAFQPATETAHPAYLTSPNLSNITKTILNTISIMQSTSQSSTKHILLVLDAPSFLLHTTDPPITTTNLTNAILRLRADVHATIVVLPADAPLLCPGVDHHNSTEAVPRTPLEADNAAFLVGMAHQSRMVLSCRRLGTGWAQDVSGVLRITRGGGVDDELGIVKDDPGGKGDGRLLGGGVEGAKMVEEGEWLYYIDADGSAKVWIRGSEAI